MAVCYAFLALTLCAYSGLLWQVFVQATPLQRRSTDRNGNEFRALQLRKMRSLAEANFNESNNMTAVLMGYTCLLRKFTEDLIERQYFNNDPVVANLTHVRDSLLNTSREIDPQLSANTSCSRQIADGNETNRNMRNVCILKYAADELEKMVRFLEHP